MPDSLATRLGELLAERYRIGRVLGQGGMAIVYAADDLKHGRQVAIKILRPEIAAVVGAERFVREIHTAAGLQHPHILGLIDSGHAGGTGYYVMPLVDGESLRDRLRREKHLPIADAVRVTCQVAAALDYAHRRGVIHRDIKPENILLQDGQALVADFGIALGVSSVTETRLTGTGITIGTPHYMSPEQATGEREISARSDVYALGCVAYEMLAGEPPFTGPSPHAVLARVLTTPPGALTARRATVPVALDRAIQTALHKLPADRYASAADFGAAILSAGTSTATPTPMAGQGEGRRPGPVPRTFRLSEDTCRRLARTSFDPRLLGTKMEYLDNGAESDVLVCFIPACGRAADQYAAVLEGASYRGLAVTFRGFEPAAPWRPALTLPDHMILVRELVRDAAAAIAPRVVIIAGFSSGADVSMRLAALPDPEARLRLDGCLALGPNLSTATCFLTSALATLPDHDDAALLSVLRRVSDSATSLDEWINLCDYAVSVVPTFRRDVAPLRAFGREIVAPFMAGPLSPFIDWFRGAADKGCRLRCVFEDTPMFRDLVRELQLRNLDDHVLGPHYDEGAIVAEAGTSHFDLIDPVRVDAHVQALVERLRSRASATSAPD